MVGVYTRAVKKNRCSFLSFSPVQKQGGLYEQIDLKHKYGVVRFEGTTRFHKPEELVFQSDDPDETMEHWRRNVVRMVRAH
jgi:hypothetical protein